MSLDLSIKNRYPPKISMDTDFISKTINFSKILNKKVKIWWLKEIKVRKFNFLSFTLHRI